MYFSRAQLDLERVDAVRLSRLAVGKQYAIHQILWRLFSSGRGVDRELERPFIYRTVESEGWPTFYLLSKYEPQDRDGCWRLATKPFDPILQAGMRLQFDLRINPVRSTKTDSGKQKRHDVVMDLKRQRMAGNEKIDQYKLQQSAALEWVSDRAPKLGFRLIDDTLTAEGYRQHVISRSGKGLPIRFSSLDIHGLLEVIEPDVFRQTLFQGIGPSKSFGCGLMLVRPA